MATEKRLIYLEDVRNALYDADAITMKGVAIINQFHAVDAVEVVHGRWNPCGSCGYRCSKCDFWVAFRSLNNYCPNCGAKMRGSEE